MAWDLDGGSFFKLWMNVCSSIIGWKDYPFPIELPLHLCWKLIDPSLCGSLLERALIFTAQSGTEILCFWLQPFETPPHGFQTGPRLPSHLSTACCWVPRTARMGCSSTSLRSWSLALVGLGCRWTHRCPRAGWSQTVFSRRCHIQKRTPHSGP